MAGGRPQGQIEIHADRAVRAYPAVDGLSAMGLGHRGRRAARWTTSRVSARSTVLNGHIHQVMQKVEGNVTFHTARSTAFPQPAPGTAPSPGPMKVEDDKLRSLLGVASINFKPGDQRARHHRHAAAGLKRKSEMTSINRRSLGIRHRRGHVRCPAPTALVPRMTANVHDRQFHLRAGTAHGEGRHDRHLDQPRRHSAYRGLRRQVQVEDAWIPTARFSFTFTAPGDYKYFCSLHPHMTGMVKVE